MKTRHSQHPVATTSSELGSVIRAVRVAAGLSQADAAAFCGVSAPFLNGLERGKESAQLGLMLKVCLGLGIKVRLEPPDPELDLDSVPRRKPRRDRRR